MDFLSAYKKRNADGVVKKLTEINSTAIKNVHKQQANIIEYVCGRCSTIVELEVKAFGEKRDKVLCPNCHYRILFLRRAPIPRTYLAR